MLLYTCFAYMLYRMITITDGILKGAGDSVSIHTGSSSTL